MHYLFLFVYRFTIKISDDIKLVNDSSTPSRSMEESGVPVSIVEPLNTAWLSPIQLFLLVNFFQHCCKGTNYLRIWR